MTVYRTDEDLQSEDGYGLVDTHCHLDLEPLCSQLPALLDEARRAGVTGLVVPGVHPKGWEQLLRVAEQHAGVYPAFGIHPMHADTATDSTLSRLAEYATRGVAIGEIGLDSTCVVQMDCQERAFRDQVRLAVSHKLPVLLHCRKAFQRTIRILEEEGACEMGGIMHAFSGSPEMAKEFIRLGFVISLCGTVTWQGATRPVRLARGIPLESIVLETDAPDLSPHPFRNQPNRPAWLVDVLAQVAAIRGVSAACLARTTRETSRRILKIPIIS